MVNAKINGVAVGEKELFYGYRNVLYTCGSGAMSRGGCCAWTTTRPCYPVASEHQDVCAASDEDEREGDPCSSENQQFSIYTRPNME